MKKFLLFILLIFYQSLSLYSIDFNKLFGSKKSFDFALNLFKNKKYYRSISEFKRFIFFTKNNDLKQKAELYIGLNYLYGKEYNNCQTIFNNILQNPYHKERQKASFFLAKSFLDEQIDNIKIHKYYDFQPLYFSPEYYIDFLKEYRNIKNDLYYQGYKQLILIHLLNLNFKQAFTLLNSDKKFQTQYPMLYKKLNQQLFKIKKVPQKSKTFATMLSIFIPGAGQIYAGEIKEGIIALFVNIATGYLAYYSYTNYSKLLGLLVAQYELTFYIGNIYNAQNAVKKYNENKKNIFRLNLLNINY